MNISIIAAIDTNYVIGNNGKLPWGRIAEDLKYFRAKTIGKPIIMGRKTFESLKTPLEKRLNIILTKDASFTVRHENCVIVHTIKDALAEAKETGAKEVMIIGGAEIFKLFIPFADHIYITIILGEFEGDTLFPKFEFGKGKEWEESEQERLLVKDAETEIQLCFSVFERKIFPNNTIGSKSKM